jgi:putative membrane protein
MKNSFLIYLKGLCMGIADLIPGVSGGTIALITGIYERLIFSIKSIDSSFFNLKNFNTNLKRVDFALFIPLGLGILSAFLIFSGLIKSLLSNFPGHIYSFFFGLILGSIYFVYKKVKFDWKTFLSSFIGFLFAFWLTGFSSEVSHSLINIFISGFIAISAMILPGISGSFILLMLGQYEYLINVIHNFNLLVILVFIFGAVLGLLFSVRIIAFLLKKMEALTLAFLIGLMMGALRLPYIHIISSGLGLIYSLSLGFLGLFVILSLEYLSNRV